MIEPFYAQSSQKVKQKDLEELTSKLQNKIALLTGMGNISEKDIENILHDYSQKILQMTGGKELLNYASGCSFLKILSDKDIPDPFLELLPLNDSFLGIEIPTTRILLNHRPEISNSFSKPRILFIGTKKPSPNLTYIETERHNISRLSQNYSIEHYEETDSISDLIRKVERADAVHFCGHSSTENGKSVFQLNGSESIYLDENQIKNRLKSPPRIIWMNSCISAGSKDSLGWAETFLNSRVRTFIGYKSQIDDKYAYDSSFTFYYNFYIGESVGDAFLKVKKRLHRNGSANWINMMMYGDCQQRIK